MKLRKPLPLALTILLLPTLGSASPRSEGDRVEISGTATDVVGLPIAELDVVLVAARRSLSWRLQMVDKDVIRISTRTDERGVFRIEWDWDRTYNRFDLQVGFPFRGPRGERFEILDTRDISLRVVDGGPVVIPIVIQDTGLLENYRAFVATVDTPDERRVFEAMGRPDKIRTTEDGREFSWWYFPRGKVYHFSDGTLVEVSDFDPVKPFDG